ncbi:helix-turn-helix domain-containing protein [Paenibacillus eucommiae]|uniref:AraC-like DNA-binding protein n=1 Tax=Paenibacillus eucommiae TaxID=1355755 RepID=A0ABS4ILY3_9BACL|nr:AraC family transcriptional regulator [Paenibacillus eucommiae]MBP1988581.1 AraC-like DNA-binding protein [Paenibacillus eucommiae]
MHPYAKSSTAAGSPDIQRLFNVYYDSMFLSRQPSAGSEMMQMDQAAGEGKIRRMATASGMEIVESDFCMRKDSRIQMQSSAAMAELSFCMQGSGEVEVAEHKKHELLQDSCSLQLIRDFSASFGYEGGKDFRSVAIGIPVALFDYYVGGFEKKDNLSFAALLRSKSFRMFRKPVDSVTTRLLHELINCPYTHGMRELFVESRALELIYRYLEIFLLELDGSRRQSSQLSRTEQGKIGEAKQLLLHRMESPPSLLELARLVGLNDYKLKVGFKEMYGKSVYAYLRDRRMEKAWELMSYSGMNVSQAAGMVGYANFSHFAAAFHKQFGFNPSELSSGKISKP